MIQGSSKASDTFQDKYYAKLNLLKLQQYKDHFTKKQKQQQNVAETNRNTATENPQSQKQKIRQTSIRQKAETSRREEILRQKLQQEATTKSYTRVKTKHSKYTTNFESSTVNNIGRKDGKEARRKDKEIKGKKKVKGVSPYMSSVQYGDSAYQTNFIKPNGRSTLTNTNNEWISSQKKAMYRKRLRG